MLTEKVIEQLADRVVRAAKATFDAQIASRDARITQLEADVATLRALLDAKMETPT